MAYLNTTSATGNSLAAIAASFFNGMLTRYQRNRMFRETFNELSALSDRDLADLGLHRSELTRVAQDSVNTAKF